MLNKRKKERLLRHYLDPTESAEVVRFMKVGGQVINQLKKQFFNVPADEIESAVWFAMVDIKARSVKDKGKYYTYLKGYLRHEATQLVWREYFNARQEDKKYRRDEYPVDKLEDLLEEHPMYISEEYEDEVYVHKLVQKALSVLSERQYRIIVKHYIEKKTVKQIVRELNETSEPAVRQQIHRGMQRMRSVLSV